MPQNADLKSPWPAPPRAPEGPWEAVEKRREDGLSVDFVGRRGALFWLALKTGILTILTLGIYRFWMKTRMRRWYWSAIRPGGHPMEYLGDPFEKLLGFFIAVVILTFYIGIVNLLLMFASFAFFSVSWAGYLASFAGVIPIWFYARYRARRYVLARTRWRGVRFALEPAAWTYAGKALWYWFLTIISVGILWPRMTFLLEKFRTDRTYFGSARLTQGGRWQMLFPATSPILAAILFSAAVALWLTRLDPVVTDPDVLRGLLVGDVTRFVLASRGLNAPERLWLVPVCLGALIYGAIHYRWIAKRIMANHKSADGVSFASVIKAPRVTMIYVLGMFISYMTLILGITLLVLMTIAMVGANFLIGANGGMLGDMPSWLGVVLLGLVYLAVFLMWGVLHNTFVTFPLMRHMAITTTLPTAMGLPAISQRARDAAAEAEGFAEALDLGAAI